MKNPTLAIPLTDANCQQVLGDKAYSTDDVNHDIYIEISDAQYGGQLDAGGNITAPIYYAVQEYTHFYDISYLHLYAFQDGQTMHVPVLHNQDIILRSYGQHQGDLERVVVRLAKRSMGILGIAYEAHGDLTWFTPDQCLFDDDTHVVVYVSLTGHSSRRMPPGLTSYRFIDEDVTILSICSYIQDGGKIWKPYSFPNLSSAFKQLGRDANGKPVGDQPWSTFCGRLGRINDKHSLDSATYLNRENLSFTDWALVKAINFGAEVLDKLPSSALEGDGPSGPGSRDWTYQPPADTVKVYPFSDGSNAWGGIEKCLANVVQTLRQTGYASIGAKVMACDARHLDAQAYVYVMPSAPIWNPSALSGTVESWTYLLYSNIASDIIVSALQGKPFGQSTPLSADQIAASTIVYTNRNDGGDSRAFTALYYPNFSDTTESTTQLNPKAWNFVAFDNGGNGDSGIQNVLESIALQLDLLNTAGLCSKIAADDRRHGDARGFLFYNSTISKGSDIEFVEEPTGWAKITWEYRNANDSTIPQLICAFLNGAPVYGSDTPSIEGKILTWAQVCSSKLIFTNRQEGDDDGATFCFLIPLIS